jgi:hypothetical protein
MGMENHGGMISTEENSRFVHHSPLSMLPVESSGSKQEEPTKEIMNLVLLSIFVHSSEIIFTSRKNMGPPALLILRRKV